MNVRIVKVVVINLRTNRRTGRVSRVVILPVDVHETNKQSLGESLIVKIIKRTLLSKAAFWPTKSSIHLH